MISFFQELLSRVNQKDLFSVTVGAVNEHHKGWDNYFDGAKIQVSVQGKLDSGGSYYSKGFGVDIESAALSIKQELEEKKSGIWFTRVRETIRENTKNELTSASAEELLKELGLW